MKKLLSLIIVGLLCFSMFACIESQVEAEGPDVWETRTAMPTARSWLAIGAVGSELYAIGGENGWGANEEYDSLTNDWVVRAPLPTPRERFAVAVVNGKIYAIGGDDGSGNFLAANEEYDPLTNTWSSKATMPTARYAHAVAVANNKIYAIGGWNGHYLQVNEEYDPATDTWTTKAPMPSARDWFSVGTVDGRIYAIGGENATGSLTVNEEYDPVTDTWTTREPMPTARQEFAIGVVNNKIYAIGGKLKIGMLAMNTNEEYDPSSGIWTTRLQMPTARFGHAIGVIGSHIYAIGGYSDGYLNVNERFYTRIGIVRAWKDDNSFGLENSHLLLYGDYIHYGGNNPVFWEYLIFKDTGTKWASPWGDIIAVDPCPRNSDPGFWQVEACTGTGEASIVMTCRTTNVDGSLLWRAEFWIEDEPYVRMTTHAINEGPDVNSRDVRMGFYTFIAGDTSNDYFYVPGVGQGQYTGTQKSLAYDPSEPWMAVWDQAKQEGCGVVWGNGFSFPPCQARVHDWYKLTAAAQGGWSIANTGTIDVGETSQDFLAYLYFFTGTGYQKTKDFYDILKQPRQFDPCIDGFWFANAFKPHGPFDPFYVTEDEIRGAILDNPELSSLSYKAREILVQVLSYLVDGANDAMYYYNVGGYCYGMSAAARYYFINPDEPELGTVYSMPFESVYPTIRDLQLSSYADPYMLGKIFQLYLSPLVPTPFATNNLAELSKIQDSLESEGVAIVLLQNAFSETPEIWKDHAVLAYNVEETLIGWTIWVYDPNRPVETQFIYVGLDGSFSYTPYGTGIEFYQFGSIVPDTTAFDYLMTFFRRVYAFIIHSPVQLHIYDSLGNHVGPSGEGTYELGFYALYLDDHEPLMAIIPTPSSPAYEVVLRGVREGSYDLSVLALNDTGDLINEWSFVGEIVQGAVYVYTVFTYDEVVTTSPNPVAELEHLKEFIYGLSDNAFGKPTLATQRKNALLNKIDEVILKVEATNHTDAINKLFHDIRAKMDGDSTAEDWIIDPETQIKLCVIIDHIISSIQILQQD